jgi:hypothetical protein
MPETDEIPKTYADAVKTLVEAHNEAGPADLRIMFFPDPQEQFVRLLLVSDDFQETGVVRPLTLGRSMEFPFRSAVALVTCEEWAKVTAGNLPLPSGWRLDTAQQVLP